ncbi:hypothetical protein ABS71_14820 [bacterium SCN 62-11]|nr:hypothetical protein [Candidatus Eremiobacteraeota bacterium]ODT63047.1 MAG: hypothetical protein ABS71_14820 [bacterium SCN 62-11]
MKSFRLRFILAALLVALMGYFFDLECLVNHCETVAATGHAECVSPVVLPDGHQPTQALEFSVIPVLLEVTVACLPAEKVVAEVAESYWPLRPPPEHLLTPTARSRRGPPARA